MDQQKTSKINIFLAPMEGVTHAAFREQVCSLGGVDFCVTEFIRVTTQLQPKKVFHRFCPELKNLPLTANQSINLTTDTSESSFSFDYSRFEKGPLINQTTPLIVQLLGSDPQTLLANAQRAVEMGAKGIDLNFGCPAKIVNRSQGGAYLLQFPDQIAKITQTLRQNLPNTINVSAKIRLGFMDTLALKDIISAIDSASLNWLTVHCRTKKNGYAPPAYWEYLPQIREWTKTPLIANGDIFSVRNLVECYQKTDCQNFMIGRGVIYNPFLFLEIKSFLEQHSLADFKTMNLDNFPWEKYRIVLKQDSLKELLNSYFDLSTNEVNDYYATAKVKGWLKSIAIKNSQFKPFFDSIKEAKPLVFKQTLNEVL